MTLIKIGSSFAKTSNIDWKHLLFSLFKHRYQLDTFTYWEVLTKTNLREKEEEITKMLSEDPGKWRSMFWWTLRSDPCRSFQKVWIQLIFFVVMARSTFSLYRFHIFLYFLWIPWYSLCEGWWNIHYNLNYVFRLKSEPIEMRHIFISGFSSPFQ